MLEAFDVSVVEGLKSAEGDIVLIEGFVESVKDACVFIRDPEVLAVLGPVELDLRGVVLAVVEGVLPVEEQVELFDDVIVVESLLGMENQGKLSLQLA